MTTEQHVVLAAACYLAQFVVLVLVAVDAASAIRSLQRRAARDRGRRKALRGTIRRVYREAVDVSFIYSGLTDKHHGWALRAIVRMIRPDIPHEPGCSVDYVTDEQIRELRRQIAMGDLADDVLGPDDA